MLQSAEDPVFTNSMLSIILKHELSLKFFTAGSAALTAFLPEDSPLLEGFTHGLNPSALASTWLIYRCPESEETNISL